PHPGPPVARGHLRLASPIAPRHKRETRPLLVARAVLAALALFAATLAAWVVMAVALAPVLWRRAPRGRRVAPIRAREARIIKFQPRQALPR
ncbi:MAG TPA: hypothetical protein VIW03_06660, partial [Anaeromyxobacter sp.]